MTRLCLSLLALIFIAACATSVGEVAHDGRFRLLVKDDPNNDRFLLMVVSEDERRLCLSDNQWPRSNGSLRAHSGIATIVIGERRIPSKDAQFGHCVGPQCVYVIEP